MRTYAEYLATNTVKTLNVIAKAMGLKGYSRLRKAELITVLTERIAGWEIIAGDMNRAQYAAPKILDVEVKADQAEIREIMAAVAPVTFSHTPVKAPQVAAEPRIVATLDVTTTETDEDDTDDLIEAYRNMRRTINALGHVPQRVRYLGRLRNMHATLKSRGVPMLEV